MQKKIIYFSVLIVFALHSAGCFGGKKPGSPPAQGNAILPSAETLEPPQLTSPTLSVYPSNQYKLTIAGACRPAPGSKIQIGGDANLETLCSEEGQFSVEVENNNEGVFNYFLEAKSLIHHPSSAASLVWKIKTTPPAPPILISAATQFSVDQQITISGSCIANYTIKLTYGVTEQTTICTAENTFSFFTEQSADGIYNYTISQIDEYGNQSQNIFTTWNKDSTPPSAPGIDQPTTSTTYSSSENLIKLSGTCEKNTIINLQGSTTQVQSCSEGRYSFDLEQTTNGTFNYNLTSTSLVGVSSQDKTFTWIHNATLPSILQIQTPNKDLVYSSTNSFNISGSCVSGNMVYLTGASTQNILCDGSNSFSFSVSKVTDGTYGFALYQQDGSANNSAQVSVTWIRDSISPITPIITQPSYTPIYSSSNSIVISGICENSSTVSISGDFISSTQCSNSQFNFLVSKSQNGSYSFLIRQTDLAGNNSSSVSINWVLDNVKPNPIVLTTPSQNPSYSIANTLTITGSCETNATVYISGATSNQTSCSSNTFTFNINKSVDGIFDFEISQKDLAGLSSLGVNLSWIRDTASPVAPTILNPTSNPLTSNDSSIILYGSCESGTTVYHTGAASGSIICINNQYEFTLSQSTDGTFNYSIYQKDVSLNSSATVNFTWIRNSSLPPTPSITSPATNPFYSTSKNLVLNGICINGNQVNLTGDSTQQYICSNNNFSFNIDVASEGTFQFNISQTNSFQVSSNSMSFTWTVDQTAPNALTLLSPITNSITNSANSILVTGNCELSANIVYSGSLNGSQFCNSQGQFSISFSKSTDGNYAFTLYQIDKTGNSSIPIFLYWKRDTIAPNSPTITHPSTIPFYSGDTNLILQGACEPKAKVYISGATSNSISCTDQGAYSFVISNTVDGVYNYSIFQVDLADNYSSLNNFQWTRDTSIPFTPIIVTPIIEDYFSNETTLSISVTCEVGSQTLVHLSGDATDELQCASSPVVFNVQKTLDGVYSFSFYQENLNNNYVSAETTLNWTRDTVAPVAVVLSSPSSNPITSPGNLNISGSCETNGSVYLTGDSTQNQFCVNGSFNFTVVKSIDANYNFILSQKDKSLNSSSNLNLSWIRNNNSIPNLTLVSPIDNPYTSNNTQLNISGYCNPGYEVIISGNITSGDVLTPANSLSQICSAGGYFSYVINKFVDGTFNLSLLQTYNGASSQVLLFQWVLDTVAPTATLATSSLNPNLASSITFTFSANESSTFQCQLGLNAYQMCSSPLTLTGLTNGTLNFNVIAIDSVGNQSSASNITWTQSAYNTVALYHLNGGTGTALNDSSYFTSTNLFSSNLTAIGSPTVNTSGKLPTSSPSSFNLDTNKNFETPYNLSFSTVSNKMTIEGLFNFSSLSSTGGNYYTLFSQSGSSSPNLGWELRLVKQSSSSCSKWKLLFVGSYNGTSQSSLLSSSCISVSTNRWYYVALTWNSGKVNFYMSSSGATQRGSGTLGSGTLTNLFLPNAPFKIGSGPLTGTGSSLWLRAAVDEVRTSNVIRTPSYPTIEKSPD